MDNSATAARKKYVIIGVLALLCGMSFNPRPGISSVTDSPAAGAGRSRPSPSPAPFELIAQRHSPDSPQADVNGLLLNPQWGWQVTHPLKDTNGDGVVDPTPDNFPDSIDPRLCQKYDFSDCSGPGLQPDFDPIGPCPMCNLGRRRENRELGHVNWRPATYNGIICFHNNSFPDMDYTFSLKPKMMAGLTRWNHPNQPEYKGQARELIPQAIHVEFDSRETVLKFQSKIWKAFSKDASPCRWWDIRNSCDKEAAMKRISQRRAVVIGLVGLDSEHDIYSELHPVYGIAIEIDSDPRHNTWIMFARNTGNEGNCSSKDHPFYWPPESTTLLTSLKLLIPPPAGVRDASPPDLIDQEFYSNNNSCPAISYYKNPDYKDENEGVLVSFDLKTCDGSSEEQCAPIVEGELHLDWTAGGQLPSAAAARGVEHCDQCAATCDKCIARCDRCKPGDTKCGLDVDEEEDESRRYPTPSALQATRLLSLQNEVRGVALSSFRSPCPPRGRTRVALTPPDAQRSLTLTPAAAGGGIMRGVTDSERIKRHYKRLGDILFPGRELYTR